MFTRRGAVAVLAVGAAGTAAGFSPSHLAGGLNVIGRRIGAAANRMVSFLTTPLISLCAESASLSPRAAFKTCW